MPEGFFQPPADGKVFIGLALNVFEANEKSALGEKKRKKELAKKVEIDSIQFVEALSRRRPRLTDEGGRERRDYASEKK